MGTHAEHSELRELDHRRGDGFDVTLLWSARSGKVYVAVEDARTNEAFRMPSTRPARWTRSTTRTPTGAEAGLRRRAPRPRPRFPTVLSRASRPWRSVQLDVRTNITSST